MRLNRLYSLFAALVFVVAACEGNANPETIPSKPEDNTPETPETPDTPDNPVPEKDPDTISILAIGNSFSVDGMQYLYDILKADGAKEIVLGNLYIGGCSLETHYSHFTANDAAYTYYKNNSGTWNSTASYKPLDALEEREWDYITMQQASGDSGVASTYTPYMDNIIKIVKSKCPDATLIWHMTWAYQGNSTHSSFPKYGSDQMTMYNAIISAVQGTVLKSGSFKKVIPSGTAVQNLRTSLYGDTITRDGYHMSYDVGRFVTGLTWAATIRGTDPLSTTWYPSNYSYSEKQLAAIREAASNAVKTPYSVTESTYPPDPNAPDPALADLTDLISAAGYNPDGYTKKEISFTKFAYYNSSNSTYISKMYNHETSTASNLNDFCTTPIFEKKDIPVGSLIVVKTGFQYRPEGWVSLTQANKSADRPGNVTANVVKVDDVWWGNWNYRAFNLLTNPRSTLTSEKADEVCASFGIFLPK